MMKRERETEVQYVRNLRCPPCNLFSYFFLPRLQHWEINWMSLFLVTVFIDIWPSFITNYPSALLPSFTRRWKVQTFPAHCFTTFLNNKCQIWCIHAKTHHHIRQSHLAFRRPHILFTFCRDVHKDFGINNFSSTAICWLNFINNVVPLSTRKL